MKRRNSFVKKTLCMLLSASMLVPYAPVFAADDLPEEETSYIEETAEEDEDNAEEALDTDISWPTPAANWYEAYEYTKDDDAHILYLNKYTTSSPEEYIVVPAKVKIGEAEYAVWLDGLKGVDGGIWRSAYSTVKGIKIGDGVRAKSCNSLFTGIQPEVLDISGLNTEDVKDMRSMFAGNDGITSLDVTKLDTSDVTDMSNMFSGCRNLGSLDLSGFDTADVTDMSCMFYQCMKIENLDLGSFSTPALTNMAWMFYECEKLKGINWGESFTTASVTTMMDLFAHCSAITALDLSGFNTEKVTDMNSMFSHCNKLKDLDISSFDTHNVEGMNAMFEWCESLVTIDFGENFKTDKVRSMSSMFEKASALTELDLSGFDTSNVTGMSSMFYSCNELHHLKLGENFKTGKVTSFRSMFENCYALESLDLHTFNTAAATDFSRMFCHCSILTELDVSGFDTSSATTMYYMFRQCYSVRALDVSHFDTSKVTSMSCMFRECWRLQELDVSNFNTENVKSFYQFIYDCRQLGLADFRSLDFSQATVADGSSIGFMGDSGVESIYLPAKAMKGLDFSKDYYEKECVIKNVYYAGTEDEWAALGNTLPEGAVLTCNFTGEVTPVVKNTVPVEKITLSTGDLTLKPGDSKWIVATVTPENATDNGVRWITDDPSVAYMRDGYGIKAAKTGTATLTCEALDGSGVSAELKVTVTEANKKLVVQITLNKYTLKLAAGKSETLVATVRPDDAENKALSWSSNKESVATVDQNGKVTAVADGTATITVTAKDGSGEYASCVVTVGNGGGDNPGDDPKPGPAEVPGGDEATDSQPAITAETDSLTLVQGQKFNIGKGWSTKDTKVISVNKKTGAVKAKKTGTATITHEDGEHKITVTIVKPSITSKFTMEAGEVKEITVSDASDLNVIWCSSAPDVATVEDGQVTAVAKGSAKITAWINGTAYKCTVKVNETKPAAERTIHLNVGKSKTIKIKGLNKPVWTVSGNEADQDIVEIKGSKITAKNPGELTLTADAYTVRVIVEDPSIAGNPPKSAYKLTLQMNAGETKYLKLTNVAQDVVFKSNKNSIAFISNEETEDGYLITARSKGTAKITAKVNGKTIAVTVKVK